MPDKIVNIGHADNVHIEGADGVELSQMSEKLDQVIRDLPDMINSTMIMAFSHFASFGPDEPAYKPIGPVSLKSKREGSINIGDVVMSHWKIIQCIGKGSLSTVYEAHHTDHGSSYKSAIKVIHSSLRYSPIAGQNDIDTTTVNGAYMIQNELNHMMEFKGTGYIVDYEDHETITNPDGSQDVIVRMELLEPLSSILRSKTLSRGEVIRVGIDICKALEFLNNSNLVHRDVKPSNIFLTKWGGYKLGDFSAATKLGDQQEIDQIGTLRFMAPEVYNEKPFSSNIDTYSLGIVLYELLNGNRMPFESKHPSPEDRESALHKRYSGKPLPKIPGVDKPLQAVVLRACAFKPEDRFSSPTEMLNELLRLK